MSLTKNYGAKPPRPTPSPEEPDRVSESVVAVGQKATPIGVRSTRSQVTIHNRGDEVIWLGGRSVSPLLSMPVQPQGYASLEVSAEVRLFLISSSPEPVEARILEVED